LFNYYSITVENRNTPPHWSKFYYFYF